MTASTLPASKRFALTLAGVLAFGGMAVLAAAPSQAAQTGPINGTGVATWGLSDYLNSSNVGRPNPKPAYYTAPSTFTAGPPALSTWGEGSGTVNADGSADLEFEGTTVNWALTGNQWLTLSDLEATFDNTGTGSVSAVVTYGATAAGATEADRWAARTTTRAAERVTIVNLTPDAEVGDANYPSALSNLSYTFNKTATKYTWSGLIGRWADEFRTHLRGNYAGPEDSPPQSCISTSTCWGYASTVVNNVVSGVSRYPSEFKFAIDRQEASTTATAVADGDDIVITVDGTGFKKTAPGVYVSLRTRTPGDLPYAGGSLPQESTPTVWVSNSEADINPNDPEQGAVAAIAGDGSFSAPLRITEEQIEDLDAGGTYTIVTRKAHGQGTNPNHADQITETGAPANLGNLLEATVPKINVNDATVVEGDYGSKNATFTVSLSEAQPSAVSVKYATANGTATAPSDFTAKAATLLSFNKGQTSKTVTIPVKGDLVAEDDETFSVVLSNANGLAIGDGTGTGTITDDEPATPHVSVGDVSVTEGNSGAKNAVFTVSLTNAAKSNVSLKYATTNGTATAPSDFTAKAATLLTFNKGQTSKTVSVALKPDVFGEPDETFGLVLSAPVGVVIDDGSATATIVNDDAAAPSASVADVSITEGGAFGTKNLVFTVQLSAPAPGAISLKYKTVNGTATAPADFTAKALTALYFSTGQTFKTVTVQVKGDTVVEPDEAFQLVLSDASVGLTIADATANGTITNDD